jgi:hypothetical protein
MADWFKVEEVPGTAEYERKQLREALAAPVAPEPEPEPAAEAPKRGRHAKEAVVEAPVVEPPPLEEPLMEVPADVVVPEEAAPAAEGESRG